MWNVIKSIFQVLFAFLEWPAYILGAFIALFALSLMLQRFLLARRGIRMPKVKKLRPVRQSILRRLFWDTPKQIIIDAANRPPDFFPHQGCIIYTGRQGRGKSVSMVHDALVLRKQYRKAKLIDNINIRGHDDDLRHWSQLISYKNGMRGVIVCIDEMQNWFSCNQSKDFPPEMLSVITQNRKNRRIIYGTSQSFHLLAKAIRSQATEVRSCNTFFGCLTVVCRREPFLDSEGNVIKLKFRGMYFFVHDRELREAYDTWHVVESLSDSGFIASDQRPGAHQTSINYYDKRRK